ncbi:hypothetical protein GALL_29770 [mine drainage metagenome]|uniref:Uncharacterized protein n=1 Tax=mine drainage metagenome TaxID=410659 RepID=A0A1J5T5U8_9ZZZZ
MAAGIQNLLQQLNASSQNTASGTDSSNGSGSSAISSLNSSFQNLVSSLDASQGQSASAANAPSLQTFLQNLMQNIGNVQNMSGSVISTQA